METKKGIIKKQRQELSELCEKNGISSEKMLSLVKNEKDKKLLRRRVSMLKTIEMVIKEESEK